MENHTSGALHFGQTWLDLNATRKEIPSGKASNAGGLTGGALPSVKTLTPGVHRFYGDRFESASGNLGMPPTNGLRVEVRGSADTQLRDGRRFATPADKAFFAFEWRSPSAEEMGGMSRELKQFLATHSDLEKNSERMSALFMVPQVRDSATLGDLLPAVKASSDAGVRGLLVPHLFAKYSNAPPVLAYYRQAWRKNPDRVWWDAAAPNVWNEEFLEPLVRGCERGKWNYFGVLARHPAEWWNRPSCVARVSTALLKHHPILKRDVREIPDKELEQWAKAVQQAGEVGNPALVELLRPALDDRRDAWINYGAGGWDKRRVCDWALIAILTILDGDSWAAFKKAGIISYRMEEQPKVYDRMIGILKTRIK